MTNGGMTNLISCDILVVGAGPAGAAAALAAAERNTRVLMVERRKDIGSPVQCAEYIPAMLLGRLKLDKSFISQPIRAMKTHVPGEPAVETRAPGFTIHRDRFDQAMARAAENAGAELMVSTRAVRRIDRQTVLLKQKDGRELLVRAKIVLGADGPRSTVGRWVGAVNNDLLAGVQATIPLASPMDVTEVYFHPEIFAGYGWLFPKREVANVGIGLKIRPGNPARTRDVLERLVSRLTAAGKLNGRPVKYAAGWIPAGPVRRAVYGNVALAGDAAGQTHPITGAGTHSAVVCGAMAGKCAAEAVRKDDVGLLKHYDDQWRDLFQDSLDRAHRRRRTMEAHWEDFPRTVKSCWIAFREYYA